MVEELCSVINVELLYLQDQRLKNYYVINVKKYEIHKNNHQ